MAHESDGLTFESGRSKAFIPLNAYAKGRFKLWVEILPEEASGNSGWFDVGDLIELKKRQKGRKVKANEQSMRDSN